MIRTNLVFASFAVVALVAAATQAAVTTNVTFRSVSAAEADGGAPAGGYVYEFFLDSDSDILSIFDINVNLTSGTIYNETSFGSDNAAPNPLLVPSFPQVGVDTFVTTPGSSTVELGTTKTSTSWTGTWGDVTNDGPQSGFRFAQFSVSADVAGTYKFDIGYAGETGPEEVTLEGNFIPEPASMALLGLGGLALIRRRRA